MKTIFTLFSILFFITTIFAQSENAPLYNPAASPDFNANLKIGDKAIAVDKGNSLKTVKIYQVKDGLYQTGAIDITEWEIKNQPNALKWYKANSVYQYYDVADFNQKLGKYKSAVEVYILCFCQKYKFKLEIASGKSQWPTYYFKDDAEKQQEKKKLDELWSIIEPFGTLPNTFLPYDKNPAIWKLIAKDRAEYVECVSKVANPNTTRIVDFYLKEIAQAKTCAQNFNGGVEGLYGSGSFEWMLRAVSIKARNEYIATQTGWNTDKDALAKINAALDELKPICQQKIPLLKMSDTYFKFHDAGCETVMKSYLKNPTTLKIYKIGISDSDWNIEKNNLGIILYRYKRGQMWVKNSADDHGFCKGLFFEIRQEYSGGGTYAGPKINTYHEELYGCP